MLLALAILAASPVPPGGVPGHSDGRCRLTRSRMDRTCGDGAPAFEFAPASGAGMGTACACANPTSATGAASTFTRASSAFCDKAEAADSIANGDLVQCATNQALVMPGHGAGSVLGVSFEPTATNRILQSQALNDAVWTATATISPNLNSAPDGTLTAETLQDTSGVAQQGISQLYTVGNGTYTGSIYLKGNSLTSAQLVVASVGGAGSTTCTDSALTGSVWHRVSCTVVATGGTTDISLSVLLGTAAGDTGIVIAWGAQLETGTYASSYVPTTTIAVARAASSAMTFAASNFLAGSGSLSMVLALGSTATTGGFVGSDSTSHGALMVGAGAVNVYVENVSKASRAISVGLRSVYARWSAVSTAIAVDSVETTGTAAVIATTRPIRLGNAYGSNVSYAVIKQVCYDTSDARCR